VATPNERMELGRLLRARWLPIVLYVALILVLSAQPGLHVPGEVAYTDKLAHTVEYGGFGFLAHRAVRDTWPRAPRFERALLTVAAISLFGVFDEVFQAGVPGRDSSVLDWAADTLGATLAQVWGMARERRREGAR